MVAGRAAILGGGEPVGAVGPVARMAAISGALARWPRVLHVTTQRRLSETPRKCQESDFALWMICGKFDSLYRPMNVVRIGKLCHLGPAQRKSCV